VSTKGDPSIGPTAVVSAVFVLFFVVTVILLQSYYGRVNARELQAKVIALPAVAVDQARTEQLQKISEYRWVDANAKTVTLPIERAMELLIAERAPKTSAP
jgi:hypothetical protein